MPESHAMGSCRLEWDSDSLTLSNDRIERTWEVRDGLIYASSIRQPGADTEWLYRTSTVPAPYPDFEIPDGEREIEVSFREGRISPTSRTSLIVEMESRWGSVTLDYRLAIFEGAPCVLVQLGAKTAPGKFELGGIVQDTTGGLPAANCMESLDLAPKHVRIRQVELMDRTDQHNELVFEREWLLQPNESDLSLKGNLFVIEDALTESGLIFVKNAPLPASRPVQCQFDLMVHPRSAIYRETDARNPEVSRHLPYHCRFYGHGIPPEGGDGYWYSLIAYRGGDTGLTRELHAYQRLFREYSPGRDALFFTNTWGDRSQERRLSEGFILEEIASGEALGADVVQIDDGWQRGKSTNISVPGGVWEGFWEFDERFWEPNPERFPRGLSPLSEEAVSRGMELGLWYAPDSSDDFSNWRRDADRLLEIYADLGIRFFKIDGVKARTKTGEANLRKLLGTVIRESKGRISFDLDVTAEIRPGYLGSIGTGPVFVENRYTDSHRYWPHQTLRNLWKLSRYIDPLRLRMEFLNNRRNADLYLEDPLAPSRYRPEYLFATVMFSNPLGWFEVSNLPREYFETVPPLVDAWKRNRDRIFGGLISPIGEAPDGTSWTGFLSVNRELEIAFLLVFRELNDRAEWRGRLEALPEEDMCAEVLAGDGSVGVQGRTVAVSMKEPLSFTFAKLVKRN
jgi:alpha-galactosidase